MSTNEQKNAVCRLFVNDWDTVVFEHEKDASEASEAMHAVLGIETKVHKITGLEVTEGFEAYIGKYSLKPLDYSPHKPMRTLKELNELMHAFRKGERTEHDLREDLVSFALNAPRIELLAVYERISYTRR